MTVTVRFAPSPTGRLHIGNARAALINRLFATRMGGRFLLRLDDTDTERSSADYELGIYEDLAWLGIHHDLLDHQSARIARYEAAAAQLRESGRLYPCYETAEDLERKRKRQHARGLPPVYDRAALLLSDAERAAFEAEGRRPHWRFKLDAAAVRFVDIICGDTHVDAKSLSDPVLIREDGCFLYTLPSVVDDVDFAISHVIRGADHLTNTGVQIQIFEALGAAPPLFAHYSLMQGPDGRPMSKRDGDLYSLEGLRRRGYEPMALNALLARFGTPDPVEPRLTIEELAAVFDLGKFGKSDIRFDPADIVKTNAAFLHMLPYEAVVGRLGASGCDLGLLFWETVRPNLAKFSDVSLWAQVVNGPLTPVVSDAAMLIRAAELLPSGPWDGETWGIWVERVKAASGLKGRNLFMPLRLALTGLDHGPELKNLLPLIGRERASARLRGETR